MRILLTFVALLCVPTQAPAEVIKIFYNDSEVQFGLPGFYFGDEREDPLHVDDTTLPDSFFADLGPLVEHELLKDAAGTIVQSNYFYSGGLFDFGSFTLPITFFGVYAPEAPFVQVETGPLVDGNGGDVYFTLGPGLLDPGLAQALGTSRRIAGGRGAANLIFHDQQVCDTGEYGTYLSSTRVACDGALWIELDVPEPAYLSLTWAGLAWLMIRHQRRKS